MADEILNRFEKLIFDDFHCDLGLLLYADNLIPFYQKKDGFRSIRMCTLIKAQARKNGVQMSCYYQTG